MLRAVRVLRLLVPALLMACSRTSDGPQAVDDLGDPLPPPATRSRIVSLNPATTEILFALGAGDRVVGRTTWDRWPPESRAVPDMGDAIRPSVETVLAARPDLVVLYASNENRTAATAFRAANIAVVSLRIDSIAEFERATHLLGDMIGEPARARAVTDSVRATLERVRRATAGRSRPTVFMISWENPLMTIGAGSFLTELVEIAGARNIFDDLTGASPQIAFEELLKRNPDYVLGSPATARRLATDARWGTLPAVRNARLLVMDTILVGTPGVRLGEAAVSLARLFHPGSVP